MHSYGLCVRVIAPSGIVDRARYEQGLSRLRALGLEVTPAPLRSWHYLAGTDDERLQELHEALSAPDCDVIWAARGGYGATRLLDRLDAGLVQRTRTILVGFSDITALHAVWPSGQTIYGANVTTVSGWSSEAVTEIVELVAGRRSEATYEGRLTQGVQGVEPVSGKLVGGNLTVLGALVGTTWLPSFEGAVVFLEDVGEAAYRLDRTLTQLASAGVFTGARGFVLGQFTRCGDDAHGAHDAVEAVRRCLAPYSVPVLCDVQVGHDVSSRALPLGWTATIDPATSTLHVAR